MNRTIPTSTTLRRSLRHAALALCALVALVAASCTTDALDGPDPNAGTNPDGTISFAVAPRPGFTEVTTTRATDTKAVIPGNSAVIPGAKAVIPGLTRDLPNGKAGLSVQEIAGQARNDKGGEGTTAPATRATQTDNATHWEQGDVLWLHVEFYTDKVTAIPTSTCTSALKYDGAEWRYLTEAEAEDLNTGNLPNFTRLLRWPRESKEWPAPGMFIHAYYTGSRKPEADGMLTINPKGEVPTTPFIAGNSGTRSPDGKLVPLRFTYEDIARVRIPAGYKVELTDTRYSSAISLSAARVTFPERITEIPEQSEDTDVFLHLTNNSTAKLIRDNVSCTFTFTPITDAEGNSTLFGASYTLAIPYTPGAQTPVAGYDLTVATEDDLRELARAVNAGDEINGKPAAEVRVLQTAKIELTQGEWVPIGTGYGNRFRGAYNGNGNEIAGLTISTPQPDAYNNSYAGLFGYAEGAVLTGIRLREVRINIPEGSGAEGLYVGSIAGFFENSTLSLCSADGTVNTDGSLFEVYAGGIAGYSYYSTISRCRADVETKAATTKDDGGTWAGGIAGMNYMYSFILSCETRDGAVTAEGVEQAFAGGIIGMNGITSLIAFCRTGKNTVTARNGSYGNYAGGLVGNNAGYLYSCYSRATAEAPAGTGYKWIGAIAGSNYEQNLVQHCYATGATGKGTSLNLDANPVLGIVYDTNPDPGEIFGVMTNYPGEVESLIKEGKTYYPFTTHYAAATDSYGIVPLSRKWTKDAWTPGNGTFPEINMEYEGE